VPASACRGRPAAACLRALPSAVSSTPGIVWEGGQDGKLRAYASATGKVLWSYDTVRGYRATSDRIAGLGGSIDGGGTVVSGGNVYTNSGYTHFGIIGSEMTGNMVLAFGLR
jgi:polyvinyl alcohol dehydrogenase (cytochrome)